MTRMSDAARRPALRMLSAGRPLLVGLLAVASLTWLFGVEQSGGLTWGAGQAGEAKQAEAPGAAPQDRPSDKELKAYIGLAALIGIVIAGLALAALIILWAGRLRRQLRRALPATGEPTRDFWFLKPPKPTVSGSSLPDSHLPPHDEPPSES